MKSMYRAVEITSPGVFSLVKERFPSQAPDRCESGSRLVVFAIRMQHTVEAAVSNLSYPRVPGHEVIGRIEEVGSWRDEMEDQPACRSWIFRR